MLPGTARLETADQVVGRPNPDDAEELAIEVVEGRACVAQSYTSTVGCMDSSWGDRVESSADLRNAHCVNRVPISFSTSTLSSIGAAEPGECVEEDDSAPIQAGSLSNEQLKMPARLRLGVRPHNSCCPLLDLQHLSSFLGWTRLPKSHPS